MKTKIIPIKAGVGHCYLVIHQEGYFLVDTGSPGLSDKIIKNITSRGLNICDLQFIFLTHTHYDHAGNAFALKHASNAPIIVHESEAHLLSNGWHDIPKGTNTWFKIISFFGRKFSPSRAQFDSVEADIVFTSEYSTQLLGAETTILHTPGHTMGSSSLLINRQLFTGDSLFNIAGKHWPPFANDQKELLKTWHRFEKMDLEYLYPAHGKRLKKQEFDKSLSKRINP